MTRPARRLAPLLACSLLALAGCRQAAVVATEPAAPATASASAASAGTAAAPGRAAAPSPSTAL